MQRAPYAAVLALTLSASAVHAHHSIGRVYDNSRQITIEGEVAEFRFVQPHSFLILEVDPGTSEAQLWRLEMDNYYELVQIGITQDTFEPGDRVTVTGSPARDEAARLYVRQLDRPADGLRYEQVGYRPRIDTPGRRRSR